MGKLTLELEAQKLPKSDLFSKSDPYVCVFLVGSNRGLKFLTKTEVIKNNLNPHWKTLEIEDEDLDPNNGETILRLEVSCKLMLQGLFCWQCKLMSS